VKKFDWDLTQGGALLTVNIEQELALAPWFLAGFHLLVFALSGSRGASAFVPLLDALRTLLLALECGAKPPRIAVCATSVFAVIPARVLRFANTSLP